MTKPRGRSGRIRWRRERALEIAALHTMEATYSFLPPDSATFDYQELSTKDRRIFNDWNNLRTNLGYAPFEAT